MALWTPADLSGSKLNRWIKAAAGGWTITSGRATAGTTSDSSASALTLVGSQGPLLNSAALNGYDTFTCNGNNEISLSAGFDYDTSIFGVLAPTAYNNYHNFYEQNGGGVPMLWLDNSNNWELNGAGIAVRTGSPTLTGAFRVAACINRSTGTAAEIKIDGTSRATGSGSVSSGNVGTKTLTLFGRAGGYGLQGDFAEFVLTYGPLTTDDEERIEGYLAWKYGLQSNLDAGHTYKSAAPTTGSSTFTATLTSSLTVSAAAIRQPRGIRSASLTGAATLARLAQATRSASTATAAGRTASVRAVKAASSAVSATLVSIKVLLRTLTAAVTASAITTRAVAVVRSASAALTAAKVAAVSATCSASSTASATLAAIKTKLIELAASVSASASTAILVGATRVAQVAVSAVRSISARLMRNASTAVAGVITTAGTTPSGPAPSWRTAQVRNGSGRVGAVSGSGRRIAKTQ